VSITLRRSYLFSVVPERLIFDKRLSHRALRLWAILDRRAGADEVTFPSRAMLAADLGDSRESVDRAVRELCEAGWLAKERARQGDVNAYVLHDSPVTVQGGVVSHDDTPLDLVNRRRPGRHLSSPLTTPVVRGDAQEGDVREETNPPRPSDEAPPKAKAEGPPSTKPDGANPTSQAGLRSVASSADFEQWWTAYPRHTAKIAAEKAYVKARRRVPGQVLLSAAQRFAEDPTREDAFTPHPATWLNRGSWEDEGPVRPEPSRKDSTDVFAAAEARALAAERAMTSEPLALAGGTA